MNPVPEPVTVNSACTRRARGQHGRGARRGATRPDLTSFSWDVRRDPEGGELCVFPREQVPDGSALRDRGGRPRHPPDGAWWAEVLGGRLEVEGDEESVEAIPVRRSSSWCSAGTGPKTVKNRITGTSTPTTYGLLVEHGATVLQEPDDEISWTVLADPEGNEFCAFTRSDGVDGSE